MGFEENTESGIIIFLITQYESFINYTEKLEMRKGKWNEIKIVTSKNDFNSRLVLTRIVD
ncbi:MAG: hypothetical protein ACJAXX_000339 [Roseivirga sp.]|jgi:hypothetical protein